MTKAVDIGRRLELFVDDALVESMNGVSFRLHEPVKQVAAKSSLPRGAFEGSYGTIIKDGDLYRAYYRALIPGYDGKRGDGHPGEMTCYAESHDGVEWTFPDLGVSDVGSSKGGNVIIAGQSPFSHNFSPFLDTRPGVESEARYKALAGTHPGGLYAFSSADGIHWGKMQDTPVMTTPAESVTQWGPYAFDSQNVAFWSVAENCYVCYIRTFKNDLRGISRATSTDFIHWTTPQDTAANIPGEHLYTSQTHPYFRAPHIYIATPSRFTLGLLMGQTVEGNNGSTDILFMTTRAGATTYQRTVREVFIRPGLDPERWERKANFVWLNVVPTGPSEMSVYHSNGDRYALRTDGFISVRAGVDGGELLTKPIIFDGDALLVNFSTSAAGSLRVEIQDGEGEPIPGFRLDECVGIVGDSIEQRVNWKDKPNLGAVAGQPVRLRFEMRECDLYSFRFRSENVVQTFAEK